MAERTCGINGCTKRRLARGWCSTHYSRWRKHGSPLKGERWAPIGCDVEDCGQPHHSRGWCNAHYRRWLKHGDPSGPPQRERPVCSIDGCMSPVLVLSRGWCNKHYHRWKRYGDPLYSTPRKLPPQNLPRFIGCLVEGCHERHSAKGLCKKHYMQRAYAANREELLRAQAARRAGRRDENAARTAAWRAANPEKTVASRKRHYEKNRTKLLADKQRYRQANRDKIRALNNRRKALKKNAPVNDLTVKQWREIKAAYGQRCAYCGCRPKILTMDHVEPLSKGGPHTASNVVPACGSCNSRKNAGAPPTYQPLLI